MSRVVPDDGPPLRVGVAGAGRFGRLHAAKYADDGRCRLAGVFDPNAIDAGTGLGLATCGGFDELLDRVEAVSIATPATTHLDLTRRALRAGRHVLVEKPLATTAADAAELEHEADARGLVLQVGHQERYVAEALAERRDRRLDHFYAQRLAAPSGRGMDVSVVLDLMTHDLDLLGWWGGTGPATVVRIEADGTNGLADRVWVRLAGDTWKAELDASRIDDGSRRELDVTDADGRMVVDFHARTVDTGQGGRPLPADDRRVTDPLGEGVGRFVTACRGGPRTGVSAADGRRAVELAEVVEAAAKEAMA